MKLGYSGDEANEVVYAVVSKVNDRLIAEGLTTIILTPDRLTNLSNKVLHIWENPGLASQELDTLFVTDNPEFTAEDSVFAGEYTFSHTPQTRVPVDSDYPEAGQVVADAPGEEVVEAPKEIDTPLSIVEESIGSVLSPELEEISNLPIGDPDEPVNEEMSDEEMAKEAAKLNIEVAAADPDLAPADLVDVDDPLDSTPEPFEATVSTEAAETPVSAEVSKVGDIVIDWSAGREVER